MYTPSQESSPESWKAADGGLLQIVDAATAEAARRSGAWLVCRPGCAECCLGVFPINRLDALRLRSGLDELRRTDPKRAARVVDRARDAVARLESDFPGDAATGLLGESDAEQERFDGFASEEPCPALDPGTLTCDLYAARPMTCRVFGPAVRGGDGAVGACELCYQGASDAEIVACAVEMDPDDTEAALVETLEAETGVRGSTIVAWCLAGR